MDLLRHLTFFVAVAEEGHFGHAADRLGMTQPPVSQGIQRLENKLGVTLLTRSSRGVRPTPAGLDLLPRARALLDGAQQWEERAAHHRQNRSALRIGAIPQLSLGCAAAIAAAVRRTGSEEAERAVIMTTAATVDLVEQVTDGRLDCAAVHHPALLGNLECGPVLALPRWLLLPAGHRAAATSAPGIRSLRGLPFATTPRGHGPAAFDLLADTLRGKGLDPAFLPAADDREVITAVAAGRAFGITADPDLHAPGVFRAPNPHPDLVLRVRLIWCDPGPPPEVRAAVGSVLGAENQR